MFDGDQFHQFIAAPSRTSLPISLSFPLHNENPSFSAAAAFDPYTASSLALHGQLHHPHQQPPPTAAAAKNNDIAADEKHPLISTNLALESERSMDPWSSDEVLTLLKVRSSLEIWFPDFTWDHVSRKLADLGYKRSPDECKEKFEEESRHFNSTVNNHNKNYRIFSELDEFYTTDQAEEEARVSAGINSQNNMEKLAIEVDQERAHQNAQEKENPPSQESEEVAKKPVKSSSNNKRKRRDKFEMFKGFCEAVVSKMMAQQEELHNKLIDDIVKRDDEKIAREEAWKNQEMSRIQMEIEVRAKEQANAAERQAAIIGFLKKFVESDDDQNLRNKIDSYLLKVNNNSSNNSYKIPQTHDDDHFSTNHVQENVENPPSRASPKLTRTPSSPILAAKNSNTNTNTNTLSSSTTSTNQISTSIERTTPLSSSILLDSTKNYEMGDVGKRWPRDEVLALINLRCKMSSNINNDDSKEGGGGANKGPLWERISQGMMELGYKRSAKRCKEKWENINKYFRKTKDSSKKRSMNSRTCPYFHQLSCLYSEGTIVAPNNNVPENQ